MNARRFSWLVLVAVTAALLAVGTQRPPPMGPAQRAQSLAASIRCPTCRGQSALDSDAATARAIRADIARRVAAGQTDQEIRDYLVSRYGTEVLLSPPRRGRAALVWVLPAVALVAGTVGLAYALWRWQRAWGPPAAGQAGVGGTDTGG